MARPAALSGPPQRYKLGSERAVTITSSVRLVSHRATATGDACGQPIDRLRLTLIAFGELAK